MSDGDKTDIGYWRTIVLPPHEHTFPSDLTGIGIGSVWVCTCKDEFVYTGNPDSLFQPVPK
jgi:hypothetical protein